MNITERRQAEKSLRKEQERLAGILRGTNAGTWEWDVQTGEVVFNQRWAEIIGYDLEEISPVSVETWMEFCHPDDLKVSSALLERHFHREVDYYECEARMRHKNGDWVWVLDRGRVVTWTNDGKPLLMMGTHQDITERKRAEEALRFSEWYLRSTLDGLTAHIVVLDDQGEIILTNKAYRDFGERNGIEPRVAYEGANYLAACDTASGDHSEGAKAFAEGIRDVLSGKRRSFELEYPCHSPEEERWFLGRVTPFVGEGPRRVVVTHENITKRWEVEVALHKAKDTAEAANRTKSEFLTNMSHEIRTPLNGVLGMLQLIRATSLDKEQEEYAEMAILSIRRLTRLLADILDLSRIEAGKMDILDEPFRLSEALHAVEQLFEPASRQTGIAFSCHMDPRLPDRLLGDSLRLQQVLNNLVGNAFKFTTTDSITVDAYPLPVAHGRQVRILFSVSDTGCGIPDHKLGLLFKPFTQVSNGFTRKHQGAGLGLVISKQLLDLMGGSISVDSEVGRGTTIHFCANFGLAEASAPAPHVVSPIVEQPGKGLRVLLAEDDRVSRLSAERQLEKAGCTVIAVENGSEALVALRQGECDAVFMDVQMPVMDGVEATRAIRAGEVGAGRRDIPVIALTAYAMAGDRERFLAAGMDGYISKPVDMDELERVLAAVVQGRRIH